MNKRNERRLEKEEAKKAGALNEIFRIEMKRTLKRIYRKRKKDARKYDFGLLVIIGGSRLYSGSLAFSAMAAFRAGVDMVQVLAPQRPADIVASFSPNIAAFPLGKDFIKVKDLPRIFEMIEAAKQAAFPKIAVLIGGGMGRKKETKKAVVSFLSRIDLPCVIDADAIWALEGRQKAVFKENFLITPHQYEFFILTKRKVSSVPLKKRIEFVKREAERLGTTILLKGDTDIISDGKRVSLNKTGCPYMTVGGTGDALAGLGGALLARGVNVFEAAEAAAYINGLAGEKAGRRLGEGMTAVDLIEEIPRVIKEF